MKKNKKNSSFSAIIAFLILFILVVSILDYLAPILFFLIGVIIIGAIGFIFLKHQKKRSNSSYKNQSAMKQPDLSVKINYSSPKSPNTQFKEQTDITLGLEYAILSTSGDENVCPMCAQFEGKIFLSSDAPKLPLCPSCSCEYGYCLEEDLAPNAVISNKKDFILPAKCTSLFHKHQREIYSETDIHKQIRLCEADLKKLPEFMEPYLLGNFPAPNELVCRDLLPTLYMQLGEWEKAEKAIKKCIDAKAYFPDNGTTELADLKLYQKVATETLSYIQQNPGCLQRNIYKTTGYEGEEKEHLKYFLRNSKQIEKVKYNNTNQLYCKTNKAIDTK